jgi:hypothetical protein
LLNTIAFPRGTHPDEIAKVKLILSGDKSFAHPILMLELARAANALAGLTDPQSIVELGRACAVLAGGLAVFASFLLAREVLPASAALACPLPADRYRRRCCRRSFASIHLPALWDPVQFESALLFNVHHASFGHDVRLPVALTHGLFHLRESLLPGLGLPLLILGLLGLAAPWLAPPERRRQLLVIAAFALLWYAVHEPSPLKPYPGYARYALPLAPLLIVLGTSFVYELTRRRFGPARDFIAAAALLAAAGPALHLSVLINGPIEKDTRSLVPAAVLSSDSRTTFDYYTHFSLVGYYTHFSPVGRPASLQKWPTAAMADIFVTSSFTYGRYAKFGGSPEQSELTREKAAYFADLFKLPYLEVTGRPSFAFFNAVIRIVALDGNSARLAPIAASLRQSAPDLKVKRANTEH